MEPTDIEEIRALINPDDYKKSLENGLNVLRIRISETFVEIDLIADNPQIPEAIRLGQIEDLNNRIRTTKWQYDQAKARIALFEKSRKDMTSPGTLSDDTDRPEVMLSDQRNKD